jgi:transcriptional regulator with XRE-family HTH domain
MIDIGTRISILRKQKGWSQTALAEKINCSRATLINYESNKNIPSIDIAIQLTGEFDVTLDYLIGKGKYTSYSNEIIKRIENIESLDINTQNELFSVIDTYLRDAKARQAYGSAS